jgi:hypothetical protein
LAVSFLKIERSLTASFAFFLVRFVWKDCYAAKVREQDPRFSPRQHRLGPAKSYYDR